MSAVLELEDVRKAYPGPVDVLHGISLTVRAGELAAVVGPSGSGKSTLLHIMGTLERATSGIVRVAGQDVGRLGEPSSPRCGRAASASCSSSSSCSTA